MTKAAVLWIAFTPDGIVRLPGLNEPCVEYRTVSLPTIIACSVKAPKRRVTHTMPIWTVVEAHTRRHWMQIRDLYPRHAPESHFRKPRTTWPPSIDHSTLLRYGMCRLGDLQSSAAASGTTQRVKRNKLSIPKRKRGTDHSCNTEPQEYCGYLRNRTPVVVHSRLPQVVAVADNNCIVPSTAINKDRKGYCNPGACVISGVKSSNILTVLNYCANFYGRVTLTWYARLLEVGK